MPREEVIFHVDVSKTPPVRVIKRDPQQSDADKRTEIQTMKMFMRRYKKIAVEYSQELLLTTTTS